MSGKWQKGILGEINDLGAFKVPSASWEGKVYKRAEKFETEPEWKSIIKVIKARDKHTCQSCRIKIGLTVHHILSRNEGGTDYPPNLITLCKFCHDEIEELGLKDRLQIVDLKYKRKYIKKNNKVVSEIKPTDWHQWVYGGYRKEQK